MGAGYLGSILVPLIVLGLGFGFTLGPTINAATARVAPDDAVVASGMANTMQPTGGSIGIALLSTLAAGASTSYLSSHPSHVPAGPCGGRGARLPAAYLISCGIFLGGAVLAAALLTGRPASDPGAAPCRFASR